MGSRTIRDKPRVGDALGSASQRPVVIEARGLEKTFRIPNRRVESLKERAVHPLTPIEYRDLHALRDVSFDVRQGEVFGIVGRNGSGKSTLLKILASIYGADAGRIRVAGRLAPFIELGVGFNPDLTARENVVLNGVMMGLSRREARRSLDSVLDFAELREFEHVKLKNYSTGMLVRLAFSMMLQSKAEIMLIDEVLAVGDAAFQRKCNDVFRDLRDGDRTVVLVTHNMAAVAAYCHRAMLLDRGEMLYLGDPEEAGRGYLQINHAAAETGAEFDGRAVRSDLHARLIEAWLENSDGDRVKRLSPGEPMRLNAVIEARGDLATPVFGLHWTNSNGVHVFGLNASLEIDRGDGKGIQAGERVLISGTIENRLTPGAYIIACWVLRDRRDDMAVQVLELVDFDVSGPENSMGVISVEAEVFATRCEGGEA